MVEGKLPGEGLAAFGQSTDDQGNLLLELARSVLADEEGGARDVAGSLEATFRDLAAAEREQDGYIGEVELPPAIDTDEVYENGVEGWEPTGEGGADEAITSLPNGTVQPTPSVSDTSMPISPPARACECYEGQGNSDGTTRASARSGW